MIEPGTILQDRYRIDGLLGHGGMGGVYRAWHLQLDHALAVKEMLMEESDPDRQEAAARQFRMEAQILHNLQHPSLPRVYDFFYAQGRYFIAMELIDGEDLHSLVTRSGAMSEAQLRTIVPSLCEVLSYLHTHVPQVIFRDLKPSNVMLDAAGRVRLIDFGIAKVFEPQTGGGTGTIVRGAGSRGYAPLEQYAGGTDPRADIYSLGATLYFLVTAHEPSEATEIAADLTPLLPIRSVRPAISESLETAIMHMMALRRTDRPNSIGQVQTELSAWLAAAPRPIASALAASEASPPRTDAGDGGATNRWPADHGHAVVTALLTPTAPTILETAPPPARRTPRRLSPWPPIGVALATLVILFGVGHKLMQKPVVAVAPAPVARPAITARMLILTEPPGAQLSLDDAPKGTTPLTLPDLTAGTQYVLKLTRDHCEPITQVLNVQPGGGTLTIKLKLLPCRLSFTVEPGTAQVQLNGKAVQSPITLAAGTYVVHSAAPGYHPDTRKLVVSDANDRTLSIKLRPQTGSVRVRGDTPVDVSIDTGPSVGKPRLFGKISVGPHVVHLSYGGDDYPCPVTVAADKTAVVVVEDVLFPERSLIPSDVPRSQPVLVMLSEPGDWVGSGKHFRYTAADSTFEGRGDQGSRGVGVVVHGPNGDDWTLSFCGPLPQPLGVGPYDHASQFGMQGPGQPGLCVSGCGHADNRIDGRFTVYVLHYGPDNHVDHFEASFVQRGDGRRPALYGYVRL